METNNSDIAISSQRRRLGKRGCFRCLSSLKMSKRQLKVYIALFMSMFGSSYAITMVFPFIPFMVKFLLPDIDDSSVGRNAGFIASAMFLGRFFGSYAWGSMSDIVGYKPVLIVSNILLGLTSATFGLSVNFPMAIITRFTVGLVNGVVGNTKAALSANSNNQNQAFGMSVLASSFGVGIVIGPALSGATADPIGQYDLNITDDGLRSFLTKFPYSIPCFINTFICLISAVCITVLLPSQAKQSHKANTDVESSSLESSSSLNGEEIELSSMNNEVTTEDTQLTNTTITTSEDHYTEGPSSSTDPLINTTEDTKPMTPSKKTSHVLTIIQGRRDTATMQYVNIPRSLLNKWRSRRNSVSHGSDSDDSSDSNESTNDDGDLLVASNKGKVRVCSGTWWKGKLRNIRLSVIKSLKNLKLFACDHSSRMSILIYCIFSFAMIGLDEIYSLWCATPVYLGGLDFTLSQIGTSLTIVGVILLPFSLTFYPFLERKIGTLKTLKLILFLLVFFVILLPNIHFLKPLDQSISLWVLLCFVMVIIRVCSTVGMGSTSVLINNSVTVDKLGSINGLALTLTSAFRFVSPIFAGSIYSASLSTSHGFPLNYHLIFIIFGVILLFTLILTTSLPNSIDRQKVINSESLQTTAV